MNDWVESITVIATFGASDNKALISQDLVSVAGHSDPQYKLIETIQKGFLKTCSLTALEVHE